MADHKPLYKHSRKEAFALNELEAWRESYHENRDCAKAIEDAIAANYRDNVLGDGTGDVIARYGFDRVNWVLANTVQWKHADGRFSDKNREWANGFFIPNDENRINFLVNSHPGLVDLFINQTRRAWKKIGLFDRSHCSEDDSYQGKLLVLKPEMLKDEFKSPDYQLFYAKSGFGCDPLSLGRKVFGSFLKDGEKTSFERSSFIGVINDEHIPEWAWEKLEAIKASSEDETEVISGEDNSVEVVSIGGIK